MKRGVLRVCLPLFLLLAASQLRAQDRNFYGKLHQTLLEMASTNPPAAMAHIDNLIAGHPRNPRYYYFRGGLYHMFGEPRKAIEEYTRSIQVFDELKEDPNDDVFKQRSREWLRLGYLEKSLADLDEVEARWPKRAFELAERGMVRYELGEYEQAARQFVNYGYAHPDDVEVAVWLMLCQAKVEDLQRARQMHPVKGETRIPMREIYALFKGGGSPEQVLEAARAAGPRGNSG